MGTKPGRAVAMASFEGEAHGVQDVAGHPHAYPVEPSRGVLIPRSLLDYSYIERLSLLDLESAQACAYSYAWWLEAHLCRRGAHTIVYAGNHISDLHRPMFMDTHLKGKVMRQARRQFDHPTAVANRACIAGIHRAFGDN